jgi:hypothetical protein
VDFEASRDFYVAIFDLVVDRTGQVLNVTGAI